jgi:membrane protein EpsK
MSAEAGIIQAVVPVRQSRRFGINLIANVGNLALTMLVGVLYVPFLVTHLGPAAYGLVPLMSMLTSYMALMSLGLNSAMGRFLTMALGREDHKEANVIFNVTFWANLALALMLVVPAAVAVANVDHILRIPAGYENAARWLFAGTVAAFLLNQVKTPFTASPFSTNRLDLFNLVAVGETLTRVGLVVGLFLVVAPRLEYIGMAILAGTVVSTVGMIKLWKTLTPTLTINLHSFDWKLLKALCCTGGWVLVSQLGLMLYLNIDLLLANRLFGPEESGRYAVVLQLPILLRAGCIAVGGIFPATMFQLYARGETGELVRYLNNAIKFLGLVMALAIGLVCGFSEPLLRLWLGPAFGSLAPLLFLMAIHLCLSLSMYPLWAVPLAANRMRTQGLVALGVGLGNLLLGLVLAQRWGLYGLAIAGAVMLTIRYVLFAPVYAARVLNLPYRTFFRAVGPILLATLATTGMCRLILWRWTISNWLELGVAAFVVSLLFAASVYLLLTPEERLALRDAARLSDTLRRPNTV